VAVARGLAMRCMVTGGAGFIGSHLVDALLAGRNKVLVLDNFSTGRPENLAHHKKNKNLTLVRADIAKIDRIKPYFKNIDVVFHLAALADIVPSIVNPVSYYTSNVFGTMSVVEASRLAGVKKVVYAASSSCYGLPRTYPTPETAAIDPRYPYALTKYLGEETLLHWGKVYKLPVVSLRLFNVYGPRSRTSGTYGAVFGVFLAQKLKNKPFTVVGDGRQTRDFIYVTDVAAAFLRAAQAKCSGEVFNIGSGNSYSVNYLVKLLKGQAVHIPKRPGEPDRTQADITKTKKMIGWRPQVSFEDGVGKVLDNIEYWNNATVWTAGTINKATKKWFQYLS
jgi:UDP-glucose 4-epimerase